MDRKLLSDIVMWIIVIIVAITVFWYAFGNSPNFEQSLFIFMLGVFYNVGKDYFVFKQNVVLSFSKVSNDISHIRRDINEVRSDIGDIRNDVSTMKSDIFEIKGLLKKK